jgi:hypothetical protein
MEGGSGSQSVEEVGELENSRTRELRMKPEDGSMTRRHHQDLNRIL